ncbi:MAG: hypothetical protein NC082_08410 [Clostridiales bacterium]|nr:hypothetical protein [Clostridiales bacterium]
MRTLRTILKGAVSDGWCRGEVDEWFSGVSTARGRVGVKAGERALGEEWIDRIEGLDLSGAGDGELAMVRDMFMFSFYCGGMELVDVAHLKWTGNLERGCLVYRRRLRGVERRVSLGARALAMLERYRGDGGVYVFPLLEGRGPAYFKAGRNRVVRLMGELGRRVGCPGRLTFGVSRYSAGFCGR